MDFQGNHTLGMNRSAPNISEMGRNFSYAADDPSPFTYSTFIMPILFGIICLVGIVGNSLVICTVFKKSTPTSSVPDIFIVNLSMVDLLFLLGMPFLIHQLLGNRAWQFGETMCTIITALDANSQFTSTYILTAMSIDRYLATVYPFTSARFRKPPIAIFTICALWGLSFLSITPVWMYAQLIPLPGGLLGCGIRLPDPQRDIYWYTLYQFFLAFAIPFTLITVAYRRILLRMARSSQALTGQRCNSFRTKKVTRVAIAICLAFFICWAPFHTLQLVQLAMHQPTLPFYYAYNVAISLGYANSCLNPFIYIFLGQNVCRRIVVSVRPADVREDLSQNRIKSARGEQSESGQPLLHLVSVSASLSGCLTSPGRNLEEQKAGTESLNTKETPDKPKQETETLNCIELKKDVTSVSSPESLRLGVLQLSDL